VNRRIESGKTGINSPSPLRKRKRWKEKSIKPLNWKHWINSFSTLQHRKQWNNSAHFYGKERSEKTDPTPGKEALRELFPPLEKVALDGFISFGQNRKELLYLSQ
jgi:hypothetical protein